MDTYETNFPGQQPENTQQPTPETIPADKPPKASPFADSPYVMNHQPDTQGQDSYQQPQWQSFPSGASPAGPENPKPKKKSGKAFKTILSCILVAALIAAGCGITAASVNSYWKAQNAKTTQVLDQLNNKIEDLQQQIDDNSYTGNGNSISGSVNTNADGLTPGQLYANCVDSVVAISAELVSTQGTGSSTGSGFIISEDGYIISNYHVVADAATLTVTTHNGSEYTAKLVGYDDTNDLALLKADATGLQAAVLGSSDDLIVGDQVVAIGNPLGELTATLTVGYVSAKERDVSTDGTVINMLQTDAAINPGNSGGPLFNMKGEVVGITTAKYSGTTNSGATIEGIGFAIPIDDVLEKIDQLRTDGYVSTPYMGVRVDDRNVGIGAYVISVESGSSAEAAGIRAGDIIVKLGNYEISAIADVTRALRDFKVGDTTTVTVYRSRQLLELTITFAQKPQSTAGSTQTPSDSTQTPSGNGEMPENGDYDAWWDFFFGDGND